MANPDCETFLRDHLGSTMERLSLAFVLLSRQSTVSSIRPRPLVAVPVSISRRRLTLNEWQRDAAAPALRKHLLDPLAGRFPEWFEYAREQLEADAVVELELAQNLLSRVQAIAEPDEV